MAELTFYTDLLQDIKRRIAEAQTRAILSVNAELIRLYWDIGQLIDQRQQEEGWGTGFIPKLSTDIRNELPEVKGFSQRNISYMLQFAREYGDPSAYHNEAIAGQGVQAQPMANERLILQQLVAKIPWGHNDTASRSSNMPLKFTRQQTNLCQNSQKNSFTAGTPSPIATKCRWVNPTEPNCSKSI